MDGGMEALKTGNGGNFCLKKKCLYHNNKREGSLWLSLSSIISLRMMAHSINNNDNNNNNKKCPKDRCLHRRRYPIINKRRVGGGKRQDGGGGRLSWQLPESSIDEYMKWIQEKPDKDQTPNEQRFLWNYMVRRLDVVNHNNNNNGSNSVSGGTGRVTNRQERIREYVDRLQTTKPLPHERSKQEEQFIRLYYQRRKDHKAQKKQQQQQVPCSDHNGETIVSCMRVNDITINKSNSSSSSNIGDSNNVINYNDSHDDNNINSNSSYKGLEPMASLASLHVSMMNLGLSSDKLKHVRFVDE
jgi:hypothetical protein